ncbi:MAG: hypothetical protein V2A73_07380 [Pseudomonadota bacterium]
MMKKLIALIGAALLAGALAVACGGSAKKDQTTPEPAAAGGDTYGAPAGDEGGAEAGTTETGTEGEAEGGE